MKTILLVDDEPDILNVIEQLVESFGHSVISQTSAEAALSLVRRGTKVDLVITDLRMPGMDGIEFVNVLRRVLPSVPLIMFSAHGDVQTYIKSLSLGVFEFLNKPFHKHDLERIVTAALAQSEA